MIEPTQNQLLFRRPIATAWYAEHRLALVAGLSAAAVAALTCYTYWTIATLAIVPIFWFAFTESEPFLLLIIALTPLGWSLRTEGLLHDIPGALRLLAMGGFFLGRINRRSLHLSNLIHHSVARLSLCFLATATGSIMFGSLGWTFYSGHSLYRLTSYILFFSFVAIWADSQERIVKILRVLMYSTAVTAGFALVQQCVNGYTSFWLKLNPPVEGYIEWDRRSTSFLNYPNSLAGYLNLLLPLAIGCALLGPPRCKALARWCSALGILGLVSTQSVGGLVAFAGVLVFAVFKFVKSRRKKLVFVVALCVAMLFFYGARSVLNPSHTDQTIGPDATIRLVLWGIAWNFFVGSPLLGIGWGNFVGAYGTYTSSFSDLIPAGVFAVHNIYLQLLAETGCMGLLVFLYLAIRSWKLAKTTADHSTVWTNKAIGFGVQGAIVGLLIHGFVDFLFQVSPQYGTAFWALLGLAVASSLGRSNSSQLTTS